jgi:hypothetical protein
MFEILLSIPSPWELILKGARWLADNLKPILPLIGIFAVILISWLLSRLIRFIKQLIGNLFTPTGAFFFIMGLIALTVFLIKFNLI